METRNPPHDARWETPRAREQTRRTPWSLRQALIAVGTVLLLTRLWSMASVPLIFTNDSLLYIRGAHELAAGVFPEFGPLRTPGTSMVLAVPVWLFGKSGAAILVWHHLLGSAMILLATWASARLAGGKWATIVGVLMALDPWLLAFESFALSELAMNVFTVSALALAIVPTRGGLWRHALFGLLVGALLGFAVLVRPAGQAMLPFAGLALVLGAFEARDPWRVRVPRGLAAGFACVLAVVATVGPWVNHNRSKGISGVARGFEVFQWFAFEKTGLLSERFPLSPKVRSAWDTYKATTPKTEATRWAMMEEIRALHNPEVDRELARWCRASAAENPGRYSRMVFYALCWQLNVYPPGEPSWSETAWLMGGAGLRGADGQQELKYPNLMTIWQDKEELQPYRANPAPGLLNDFFDLMYRHPRLFYGWPQVVLFGVSIGAFVLSIRRRRWAVAGVLLAVLAYLGVHVLVLSPYNRYALPVWAAMYLAPGAWIAARAKNLPPRADRQGA
jgi:4-amino-4-deoxy-L-arabinose transferase-like glycosyltransferase